MADALVSGSSEAIHVGSSPVVRTNKRDTALAVVSFFVFARAVTQNPLASTARDSGDVCLWQTRRIDTKWISMFNLPVVRTRKRLRIGYNSESFSTKSAYVGINPLSWMKSLRDEIPLTRG